MAARVLFDSKNVLRLLSGSLGGSFDTIVVEITPKGLDWRGLDKSRTIALELHVPKAIAREFDCQEPQNIAVDQDDISTLLSSVHSQFEDGSSELLLRIRDSMLEVVFKSGSALSRKKAFSDVPEGHFTLPRWEGLARAATAILDEPWRLVMASTSFFNVVDVSLGLSPGKVVIQASEQDSMTIRATVTGQAQTKFHHGIFNVLSPLSSYDILSEVECAVVNDGVSRFRLTFGKYGVLTYYVSRTMEET